MLFGAHVSIAGGIVNAPTNAAEIGCEVFQMFTRSPQGGTVKPIDAEAATRFKELCLELKLKEWFVHAPYFINFASANPRIRHSSPTIVRQELERSSLIGAKYLMFHVGSYKDLGKADGFKEVVKGIATVMDGYKGTTQLLIENAAGAGEVIGASFEEIAEILESPELKPYDIGVCMDTEHAFASGYDLRTPATVKKTFDTFDATIGLKKLKMFHCNDSKIEFNGHKDRHEHIGDGFIGKAGFESLFAEPRIQKLSFIAETEHDKIIEDLTLLKKMRDEKK